MASRISHLVVQPRNRVGRIDAPRLPRGVRKSPRRYAATPFVKGGDSLPPLTKGAANAVSGGFVAPRTSVCRRVYRRSLRFGALLSIASVALAAGGCASATARFYTLDATATAGAAPAAHYAVLVGPVSVPPAVDRPQFVVQAAPNRVDVDEFNRWAAPLNDAIARAVAGDLAVLLGTQDVAVAPLANFKPAYRVSINVQRFESVPGETVLVDAVWAVSKTAGAETSSGRTVAHESVQGKGFDALAAAHSRALAKVSSDIAAAIRAANAEPESPQIRNPKSETRSKSKTTHSKKPTM
jgi:uncharacterized lipoprotein YmbA